MRRNFAYFLQLAVLTAVYVVTAKLGLRFGAGSLASLVWPPAGIALAALLVYGKRLWPAIAVGAFVVNFWAPAPLGAAVGIALGNTLEAVLAAYAIRRLAGFNGSFDRLGHVIGLILIGATFSTLVSATIGAESLVLGGVIPQSAFLETWHSWWFGDMLGDLIVAPLLLTWLKARDIRLNTRQVVEALALTVLLTVVCIVVFFRPPGPPRTPLESTYILFPMFIWAAVRFGLRGSTAVIAFTAVVSIWATTRGFGPFVRSTLPAGLLVLQTFTGSATLTTLVVGGAIADRARAIHARDEFVAIVSHDLKNPLNALGMSSELLLMGLDSEHLRKDAEKHGQIALRSVRRMTTLIGDLLDVAAIEAGRVAISLRPEDLGALVSEALDNLQPLAVPKKQTLRVERFDTLRVKCDRDRVLRVLSNLVGNAIKFTADEGTIVLRAERTGSSVCLSVQDTGTGIEASQLRHVFERFWQARPASNGGNGLGLFIAKGIVEAHGGKMWAHSRVGAGTTFFFTLPLVEDQLGRTIPIRSAKPGEQPT